MDETTLHFQHDVGDPTDTPVLEPTVTDIPAGADFDAANAEALPVFERAASTGYVRIVHVGGSSMLLAPLRKGRKSLTVWVPASFTSALGVAAAPLGVMVSSSRTDVDTGVGVQLNPGDSFKWDSESALYVGPLPTGASGLCQALETFNPLGGPVGN